MAAAAEGKGEHGEKRRKRQSKAVASTTNTKYSVCSRSGGRFSSLKPVFSKDERYVFLSTLRETRVYSTTTGELVRSLAGHDAARGTIVAINLHPDNDYRLITTSSKGSILTWDWTDGSLIKKQMLQPATEVVASILLGTTFIWSDGKQISMCRDFPDFQKVHVINKMSSCQGFHFNGEHVLAHGEKTIFLFKLKVEAFSGDHEHLTLPTACTAIAMSKDAYAYADATGAIFVHQLSAQDSNKDVKPRKLHWHSSSVHSLEFALNGQYLLSGGEEGVLVLWQLKSSNRQYLPRIARVIHTIAASNSSKLYALKTDDNSVKIINATNLELQAEILGPRALGIAASCASQTDDFYITSGDAIQSWNLSLGKSALKLPVVSKTFAGQVRDEFRANDASVVACAVNQEWLATIDSWCPPKEEAVELGYTQPQDEVYLKFWKWSGTNYELVTRVDGPHGTFRATQVIAGDRQTFFTVGDDATVKLWRQKTVKKDLMGGGTEVVGTNWTCLRIYKLTRPINACKIALSADSSILALNTQDQTFLIDAASGDLKDTLAGFSSGKVTGIGFVQHHLVILGFKRLVVWDLLYSALVYALRIPAETTELQLTCGERHFCLATNEQTRQKSNAKVFIFDPLSPKPIFREKSPRTLSLSWTPKHGFIRLTDELEIITLSNAPDSSVKQVAIQQDAAPKTGISSMYKPLRNTQAIQDVDMQETVLTTQDLNKVFDDPSKTLEARFQDLALLVLGPAHASFDEGA